MLGNITLPSIPLNMTVFKEKRKNNNNQFSQRKVIMLINLLRASYIVSEKIAKHSKNYFDGEFVKDCLLDSGS